MELCKEAEEREEYESIGNFEMYFPGEACGLGVLVLQLGVSFGEARLEIDFYKLSQTFFIQDFRERVNRVIVCRILESLSQTSGSLVHRDVLLFRRLLVKKQRFTLLLTKEANRANSPCTRTAFLSQIFCSLQRQPTATKCFSVCYVREFSTGRHISMGGVW
jgi:hypothetical protein